MTNRTSRLRLLPPAAAALALLLTGACGGDSGSDADEKAPKDGASASAAAGEGSGQGAGTKKAAPASLEKIASTIGCEADVTVDAKELRQGACTTDRAKFTLLTFSANQGQDGWLAEARDYGGTYLVGTRWIVTAEPKGALDTLQAQLGGSIENGASHGSGHSGGSSGGSSEAPDHAEHSGHENN